MRPSSEATYDAVERARSESEDHTAEGAQCGQHRRDRLCLRVSEIVELGVGLPLDATRGVPLGPAVAQQNQINHGQGR